MKRKSGLLMLLILGALVLNPGAAHPQTEKEGDRTLSPYFLVKSDDAEPDQLPLKSASVEVNISGTIADVRVTQVYENEGRKPLEAIYVFPASTRAAVYGMKMTIGERTVTAEIREREAARREYEQARQAGKSASLLEQQRPNVFQMNVANILPSDVIKVELKYTELLVPTDAVYEFVYPTVVGPRYTNQQAPEADLSEQWTQNPYHHQGEPPTYTFDIAADLSAGLPIQDISCSSHKVNIDYDGPTLASIKLDPSEKQGGNRDFLLKYRLAGGQIQTGLLLYEGEEEDFFLLMLQPPKRVTDSRIPPREYVFIVDVSGSMHGFPLTISKKLLKDLIGNLRPTDRFNVLLFAGGASVMSKESLPAKSENIAHAINVIERQRGGGGTELLPALKKALSLPRTEGYSRSVVIATDGYVAVEEEAFDLIRNNLGDANMFAFGIGTSVNRHIIEGMARVGMGEPFIITKPEEAPKKATKFRKLIQSPVLTGIKIDFGKFDVYDVEPPSIPDVLADRPVTVFGKWRGKAQGHISLRGIAGDGPFVKKVDVAEVKPLSTNSALRYLWARHRIALLSDYNNLKAQDERVREVTRLGLTYNLLTPYTSFVAIDTQIRVKDGKAITVKQPLPLPQGVSDYAAGEAYFAKKALSYAPLPSAMDGRSKAREVQLECKDELSASESEVTTPAIEGIHIELGNIVVQNGLSKRSIQRLLEKHMHSINLCYEQVSGSQSKLKGEVIFRLVIDPQGRVTSVHVDTNTTKDKELERCIMKELTKLHFPAPERSKNVKVSISFTLDSN
jgi:Ca-activated chloride channel family protein